MLTHLEHFEFSSLKQKFLSTHFGFENRLDRKLFFGRNVGCKIYNTKLTTSQKLLNSVGIINVFSTAYFLKSFDPFLLLSLSAVVENADLILSKDYLNRVQGVAWNHIGLSRLNKCIHQTVHHLYFVIILMLLAVEFFPFYEAPVLLKPVLYVANEASSINYCIIFLNRFLVAKSANDKRQRTRFWL